jgi:hypothetical protein
MSEEITRIEGAVSYFIRPDHVCVGARAAWDYFVAQEQAKPVFERRLPVLMFYGRTDRNYWFMQFRDQHIEKVTPAEVKAATKQTKKILKHYVFQKTFTIKADDATLAEARHTLVDVAEMLDRAADMKEARDANPRDKRKNHFADSPPPEFTRAQATRLIHMAMQLG